MTDSQKWLILAGLLAVGWLVFLLGPVLTPFAIAALIAYLGDPLADRLEKLGLGRTAAVSIVFAGMSLVLISVFLVFVPLLEHQISRLITNLPVYAGWIKEMIVPWVQDRFDIDLKLIEVNKLVAIVKGHWQQAGGFAKTVLGSISKSGLFFLEWLMNLVLIPVVAFYLLRDWDIMVDKIRDLLPKRYEATVVKLTKESDLVLGAFLKGQFSVMLALASIYSIGLWIVDLDLALLIGMVAGLISFIPYLGSIVGVAAGCMAAFVQFHEFMSIIPVLVVFGIGQTLEGVLLTPWLVGDKVGLHPVAVIFAVLAGGQLFGFIGILLALPAASVIMVLIRHVHELYKDSQLYSEESEQPRIMVRDQD